MLRSVRGDCTFPRVLRWVLGARTGEGQGLLEAGPWWSLPTSLRVTRPLGS